MKNIFKIKRLIKNIKVVVTDCDGVLTDAGMYYNKEGDLLKKFNTKDGMAFSLLKTHKFITGIITGENSEIVKKRSEKLKMDFCVLGSNNKLRDLINACEKYNANLNEILYFGDDLNDLEIMQKVAIAVCPKDACKEIKKCSHFVTKTKGGNGVIREFFDKFF